MNKISGGKNKQMKMVVKSSAVKKKRTRCGRGNGDWMAVLCVLCGVLCACVQVTKSE